MRQLKNISFKTMLIICALPFFVYGCGSNYDEGYEDGWEGTKDGILYSFSRDYKQGYENGDDDAYFFDLGCEDAESENIPRYPDNVEYMRGYDECN